MVYFIVIILCITQHHRLKSEELLTTSYTEKSPLLDTHPEEFTSISLDINDNSTDTALNTVASYHPENNFHSQVNKIKQFFLSSSALELEKKMFEINKPTKWNGYANPLLIGYAQEKINQTPTKSLVGTSAIYIQLLKDLIVLGKSHDEEHRKKICTRLKVSLGGSITTTVAALGIYYFSDITGS